MSHDLVVRCREVSGALMAFIEKTPDLKARLDNRYDRWNVNRALFKKRLSALALVVCYALAVDDPRGDVGALRLEKFLDVLRDSSLAELFAPIRIAPEFHDMEDVRDVWVVSVWATGMTPHYFGRLHACLGDLIRRVLTKTGPDCTAADLMARAAQPPDDTA
ncbi:hypothetical protein ACQB60_20570 [Actinomycetota bacterium Odt1-20B]